MIYEWKKPLYKIKAQDAGQYFDSLAKRDGYLKPNVIVKEAESETALLHTCFEWNNTTAAQKYRENQAKAIIRNIVTVYKETEDQAEIKTRAFVHVSTEETTSYLDINSVIVDDELRKNLLDQAKKELLAFQTKYKTLNELSIIFDCIKQIA